MFDRFVELVAKNLGNLKFDLEAEKMIHILNDAKRIFLLGVGRSGLVAKAFAMRLMHLGYSSYVVGETITPRIGYEDVLLAVSNRGETDFVISMAKKAKNVGAKVVVVTSSQSSTLAKIADHCVVLKIDKDSSLAPLGTAFEILAMIFFDAVVAEIMARKNLTEEELAKRHALE